MWYTWVSDSLNWSCWFFLANWSKPRSVYGWMSLSSPALMRLEGSFCLEGTNLKIFSVVERKTEKTRDSFMVRSTRWTTWKFDQLNVSVCCSLVIVYASSNSKSTKGFLSLRNIWDLLQIVFSNWEKASIGGNLAIFGWEGDTEFSWTEELLWEAASRNFLQDSKCYTILAIQV